MLSFKFCTLAEIFIEIGPWAGAKLQAKHARLCANCKKMADFCTIWRSFKDDGVHETSEAALGAFLKGGGVLETTAAAADTCLNLAVSLQGTCRILKLFCVLETIEAAPDMCLNLEVTLRGT